MVIKKTLIIFSLFLFFCSCKKDIKIQDSTLDEPFVEVKGEFLYKKDIKNILPENLSKEDSITYINNYIKKWAVRILMYEKANKNINDDDEIEKLVSDYRKSLVIHRYQEKLIVQKIKSPSESEMQEYYNANSEIFKLNQNLIMGLYMKVPKNAPKIDELRHWINNQNSINLEKIEKYSYKNAVSYEYFGDHWVGFDEVICNMPIRQDENVNKLLSEKLIEREDNTYKYILHINKYKTIGSTEPFDFAKDKIKIILMNVNKTNYINQVEDELYNKAEKRGIIKRYNE